MIGDHYQDWWPRKYPNAFPPNQHPFWPIIQEVTREEFDSLKRDVEEMKALLKRAVKYDEDNNEPHCEIEEKMDLLRKIAEAVGINLDDVIGAKHDS
jgi:hypothetical protein